MDISEVYAHVLHIYLSRLQQENLHPRQAAWSAQFILENFTPFSSQAEWDAFSKASQNSGQNLGKNTPTDVGIDQKYVTWAKALWAKYARFKTHILNVVNVDFKALLTKGRLKSGQQTGAVVEQLRRKYFDEWCTTTDGVITHTHRPIEECVDWQPGAWWYSWCMLGPPQGVNACAPFMDVQECPSAPARLPDATGPSLPAPISDLLTNTFQGRKDQRDAHQRKALAASKPADFLSPPSKVATMKKVNEVKQFEAHLKEREAKMTRLDQLLAHEGFSGVQRARFQQEKMELMLQPIVSLESCGGITPNTSQTVTEDEGSSRKHQVQPRKMQDELDIGTCVEAGLPPDALAGDAAHVLGQAHSRDAFKKTSPFHSRVVHECKRLFQGKKPSSSKQLFKYLTQKELHVDAGYDPNFADENVSHSILTEEDVAEFQPAFLKTFSRDFDIIQDNLPANDSMFEAFVTLVCNQESLRDQFSATAHSLTIPTMRVLISDHIQEHAGVIPGSVFNFEEDRCYIPDFEGNLEQYCRELSTDRCGDHLVLHAFCHKFLFDAVLFSVKEPGGTLHQNSVIARPADVFSMLLEVNVESDSVQSDRFSLVMPKGGSTKNNCSSFLNSERCLVTVAEEKLKLAESELHKLRSDIAKDEQSVRFRSHSVNQKIRNDNKAKLENAEAARDAAKKSLENLKGDALLDMVEDPIFLSSAADLPSQPAALNALVTAAPRPTPVFESDEESEDAGELSQTGPAPLTCQPLERLYLRALDVVDPALLGAPVGLAAAASAASFLPITPVVTKKAALPGAPFGLAAAAPAVVTKKPASRSASPGMMDYDEYRMLHDKLPLWNVDLEVFQVDEFIGRGIRALRKFKKGEVIGMYDGHRCDEKGNIKIRLPSVSAMLSQYPILDREKNKALSFQPSHSVSVCRTHLSGLYIDGGPLCDPILDSLVNNFGRLALANSASSPQQANMKPKWVKSPNLPRDYVNGQADTECFFTATRDIESGEEFLWAYPLDHHMNQQVVNHNLLPSKRMMPPNGSSSHPAIKAAPLRVPHPMTLPLPHQCHHFTTCIPGKCCDCNCAKCKANQVSGRRIPKPKAAE